MASIIRSFTEISVVIVTLAVSTARADVLGYQGPLVPAANGSWDEFRTDREDPLVAGLEEDASCVKNLPENLRMLFFEHFRYYVDHARTKIGEPEIARFAKVLGMATHESGGASAAVTDMHYKGSSETAHHFYNTDNPGRAAPSALYSSTDSLDALLSLPTVKWDQQTNFGLLQMSADRLVVGGPAGDLAKNMIADLKTLFLSHPDDVIDRCGTNLMFKDSERNIRAAFQEIQNCKVGTATKSEVQCFGRWATLCPNYNISLALVAPVKYFATRRSAPLCAKTFRRILLTGRRLESVPTSLPAWSPYFGQHGKRSTRFGS
jgi:hypothetical protein